MSKHTPGPYTITDRGKEGGADVCAVVPNWTEHPSRIAFITPWPNYMDNANLFAAAPELLEALKNLVPLARTAMKESNCDGGEYEIEQELAEAKAAIAKAEATHD